jgi:hypothetical protein
MNPDSIYIIKSYLEDMIEFETNNAYRTYEDYCYWHSKKCLKEKFKSHLKQRRMYQRALREFETLSR